MNDKEFAEMYGKIVSDYLRGLVSKREALGELAHLIILNTDKISASVHNNASDLWLKIKGGQS